MRRSTTPENQTDNPREDTGSHETPTNQPRGTRSSIREPPVVRVLSPERFTSDADDRVELVEPGLPENLPEYLADPLSRQDRDTLEQVADYALDMVAYLDAKQQQPVPADEIDRDVDEVVETTTGTLVSGKWDCGPGCGGCPHGPYTIRVFYDEQGKRTSEYVGKGTASEYGNAEDYA